MPYSGNPADSDDDETRFWMGDVSLTDPDLNDNEITFMLSIFPDPKMAAFNLLGPLLARLSDLVDKKVGDLSIRSSQKFDHYTKMKTLLDTAISISSPVEMYMGGQSEAELLSDKQDTDLPDPDFRRNDMSFTEGTTDAERSSGW